MLLLPYPGCISRGREVSAVVPRSLHIRVQRLSDDLHILPGHDKHIKMLYKHEV